MKFAVRVTRIIIEVDLLAELHRRPHEDLDGAELEGEQLTEVRRRLRREEVEGGAVVGGVVVA